MTKQPKMGCPTCDKMVWGENIKPSRLSGSIMSHASEIAGYFNVPNKFNSFGGKSP